MLSPAAMPIPAAPEGAASSRSQNSPRGGSASHRGADCGAAASYAYAREDLSIRFESKDGDVLEVRRTVEAAVGYTRAHGSDMPGAGLGLVNREAAIAPEEEGPKGLEALLSGLGEAADKGESPLDWARAVSDELRRQQARLLESFLKGPGEGRGRGHGHGREEGAEGSLVVVGMILVARSNRGTETPEGAEDAEACGPLVPEYWNAENTSDRIVSFATSFAAAFGDSEFAKTITAAVAEGFAQAEGAFGELPGAAGKLRQETRDMTFAKLEKWLEAWEAGAYNQGAQTAQPEPALPDV